MNIKEKLQETAKTAKFDGITIDLSATSDSRLQLEVRAKGSVDLPGDLDQVVAQIGGLLGLGNSQASSQSSGA